MVIRRQFLYSEYCDSEKRFVGYIDFGVAIEESENLVAKEALVYMLTGLSEMWKVPVVYFFCSRVTMEEYVETTKKVIDFVSISGVCTHTLLHITLTFDGLPANISMCKTLEADIFNDR